MANNEFDLARLRRELLHLQKDLSGWDERLDNWVCNLGGSDINCPPLPAPVQQKDRPKPASPEPAPAVSLDAGPPPFVSAGLVKISPLPGGAQMVQIDIGAKFKLTPALAALLQVLCANDGVSTDSLVGWKPVADIQLALTKRLGGGFSAHAVKQLVLRLRNELERHGEKRSLIQGHRNLGYRFELKRGGDL